MEEAYYSLSIFQKLPSANVSALFEYGKIMSFATEASIYTQGSSLEGIYIVLGGHVKLCRQSEKHRQVLALLRIGDSFGIETFSELPVAAYGAESADEAKILFVPSQIILELLEAYPQFRLFMIQLATDRLRQFAGLVADLAFRDVSSRLATLLLRRAETEGSVCAEGIRFPSLLNQSEIAAMIGTGREVVQRTFKKFERMRLLRISRKETVIFDMEKLRQIAEEENR